MNVPEVVKEHREKYHLSLRDLEFQIAMAAGFAVVSAQTIQGWESGRHTPRPENVAELLISTNETVRELGVSLATAMGFYNEQN
jgi:transcriptional regulator with XRE-family HTH domain